jgi:predicted metal-dependent phosphoesterase TrpH
MIDMHIHTNHSDSSFSVQRVLEEAEKLKLSCISITDHDRCSAYDELKTMDIKKYYSGRIVPGIEIKCFYNGRLMDLLGYNYDIEKMQKWLDEYYKDKQRADVQTKYFNHFYEACQKLGLKVTPKEEIIWNPDKDWASFTIYNDFKKYEENKEKLPEDLWEDFTTFTKKYCADENNIFHVDKSKDYPTIDVAVKAIKDCGGVAIMAHIFIYKWTKDKKQLIQDIMDNFDIDGFECYYSKFSEEETNYIVDVCKKNHLYMSGGSDSHGANKPDISIGTGRGNLHIEEKVIEDWVNK